MIKTPVAALAAASTLVGALGLSVAPTAQAGNMFNFMNPSKWFDNDDDDWRYWRRYGGYGGPYGGYGGPYGWGGYPGYGHGWGNPWGGYGYPGYYGHPYTVINSKSDSPPPPPPKTPE